MPIADDERAIRLRAYTAPQYGCTYADEAAFAKLVETGGFDAYFRADHYVPLLARSDRGLPGPTDAWTSLAGLARDTTQIRLGTLMSCASFRLPGVLAVTVAQVDEMSLGRVELGLGAGWNEEECRAYGIPFADQRTRLAALEEQLEIILGIWATPEGEQFTYAGEHYELRDCPALPKPWQQPRPPVVLSAGAPRRVARWGDEANVAQGSPSDTAAAFARVRDACVAADRDPDELRYSVLAQVVCGEDADAVAACAARAEVSVDAVRTAHGIVGTPAEVVEQISAYVAAGADTVYLYFPQMLDLAHLALVASAVVPEVSSWTAPVGSAR